MIQITIRIIGWKIVAFAELEIRHGEVRINAFEGDLNLLVGNRLIYWVDQQGKETRLEEVPPNYGHRTIQDFRNEVRRVVGKHLYKNSKGGVDFSVGGRCLLSV